MNSSVVVPASRSFDSPAPERTAPNGGTGTRSPSTRGVSGGLNYALSEPIGTIASADQERWNDSATNALLATYANAQTNAQRQSALYGLEAIQVTKSPTVPFAESVAWSEYSTAKVTGWPSASNPYTIASPLGPSAEYVLLHLVPVRGS